MTLSPKTKPDGCARGVPLKDGKRGACHQRVKIAVSQAPKIRAMASTPRPNWAALQSHDQHYLQQNPRFNHDRPSMSGTYSLEMGLSPVQSESPLNAYTCVTLDRSGRRSFRPPTTFMRSPL